MVLELYRRNLDEKSSAKRSSKISYFAPKILQHCIRLRDSDIEERRLKSQMVAPLAIWHQDRAEVLADAVAAHDEVGPRRVDVAALVKKISRRFVVAENDNGVDAGVEGGDRAVLLGPLRVGATGVVLQELVNVVD